VTRENQIANELQGNTEGAADRHLLLDFTNVKRLSSCELGTLITLHKRLIHSDGRLTLFNVSASLFEVFSLTRLDTLLGICRESALAKTDPSSGGQIQ
jgi:anti-anti-sigma factor